MLGAFLPSIRLNGRSNDALAQHHPLGIKVSEDFTGTLINPAHIGSSLDDLIGLQNADHPDNPVLCPAMECRASIGPR